MRVSLGLCILWLIGTIANVVYARAQEHDAVSLAEHEKLKADMASADAGLTTKLAVLDQKMQDMDKLLTLNTAKIADMSTTINREEGLGLAFGTALILVQWWLYRVHIEAQARIKEDSGNHDAAKRPSGSHKAAH